MPDVSAIGDAVDTVAREMIARLWESDHDISDRFWGDFPEIGENDLYDVVTRAGAVVSGQRPAREDFDQAYRLLASRAKEDQ